MTNERLDISLRDYFLDENLPDRTHSPDAWYHYSHGYSEFILPRYLNSGCHSDDPTDNRISIEVKWDQRGKFRSAIRITHDCVSIWRDEERYDHVPTFMINNIDDLRAMVLSIINLVQEAIERERIENENESD
jgi:hypothetical protein